MLHRGFCQMHRSFLSDSLNARSFFVNGRKLSRSNDFWRRRRGEGEDCAGEECTGEDCCAQVPIQHCLREGMTVTDMLISGWVPNWKLFILVSAFTIFHSLSLQFVLEFTFEPRSFLPLSHSVSFCVTLCQSRAPFKTDLLLYFHSSLRVFALWGHGARKVWTGEFQLEDTFGMACCHLVVICSFGRASHLLQISSVQGVIDTALRTANSGYLYRRLDFTASPVVVAWREIQREDVAIWTLKGLEGSKGLGVLLFKSLLRFSNSECPKPLVSSWSRGTLWGLWHHRRCQCRIQEAQGSRSELRRQDPWPCAGGRCAAPQNSFRDVPEGVAQLHSVIRFRRSTVLFVVLLKRLFLYSLFWNYSLFCTFFLLYSYFIILYSLFCTLKKCFYCFLESCVFVFLSKAPFDGHRSTDSVRGMEGMWRRWSGGAVWRCTDFKWHMLWRWSLASGSRRGDQNAINLSTAQWYLCQMLWPPGYNVDAASETAQDQCTSPQKDHLQLDLNTFS